ncbi:MAG: hypothetical protein JWM95_2309 [Gemmatimonadetes bacterium]|nr:hypothetical protein [Gemmatimonadota bacterium]
MRKRNVWLALLAIPVLLVLVVLILVATPWGNERVRRVLVSQANKRIFGELAVGGLRGNLLTGAALTDVLLTDSTKQTLFSAKKVSVRYGLLPALRGHVVIHSLVLDTAFVLLDKKPGARWNFQSLSRPSGAAGAKDTTQKSTPPVLDDITIHAGRFLYRRPWAPDSTLPSAKRDAAIAAALSDSARRRTERVTNGFQRVLDYHDMTAHLESVRIPAGGRPIAVEIAALAMLAEPYRPPAIDVRSLAGTLYASKDSLWWHGAHMTLPGSTVSGDGKIGFHRSGFTLDLAGAPLALADLRWLNTRIPDNGGGNVRYRMSFHGDTSDFAISNADLKFQGASLAGDAAVAMVKPATGKSVSLVRSADLTVAHLDTRVVHELVPSVKLGRSGILDGHFVVSGSTSNARLNADVAFDDERAGVSKLTARGGIGFDNGFEARDLSVRAFPMQVRTLTGASSKTPITGIVTGDAVISGSVSRGWTARGDLTHTDGPNRSRISGNGSYQTTGNTIIADATLEPLSLLTVGKFAPSAELQGSVTGQVHVTGTMRDLHFTSALASRRGGTVDAKGTVHIDGSRSRYDVALVTDALNTRTFSKRAPVTSLTGTISARGTGTAPATANATIAADLSRSRYDTFTVESVHARTHVAGGLLTVDSLAVSAQEARATAHGTFGLVESQHGTLQFSLLVDSLGALRSRIGTTDSTLVAVAEGRQNARLVAARKDSVQRAESMRIEQLALGIPLGVPLFIDTLPPVRRDSLAGSLAASGILSGNVKELGIDATIRGSGLVIRGTTVRQLSATVSSPNVRDHEKPLRFDVEADTVQLDGMSFVQLNADGVWQQNVLTTTARVRQDSLVSYAALGRYANPATGVHDVRIDSLRAQFDTLVWRLQHPARVRVAGDDIAIDSVDLRSSAGERLFANGIVPGNGDARLDVAVESVRVSTILGALQRDAGTGDGSISLTGHVAGTRVSPSLIGNATLRKARYKDTRAPDADVAFHYFNHLLSLDAEARDSTGHRVASATAALPLDLALSGAASDRLLQGPLVADVIVDSLALTSLPIRLYGYNDIRGALGADAHVRGTWKAPQYFGLASLRGAGVTIASTGMKIERGTVDVRLRGDSLILDSLVAFAHGELRVAGTVDMHDTSHPFVRMSGVGRDLRVFDSIRGLVDADADFTALGPLDALRVNGHGEMKGGFLALKQFPKDLLRVKAPGTLSFFTVFDTSASDAEKLRAASVRAQPKRVAVIADLSLVVDRGSYYRSRPDGNTEFYTGVNEEVRAHLDQRSGDEWAIGFVHIGDGSLFFRTRAFIPARGTMTLTPVTGAPGLLQQVGERVVWEPGRGLMPLQFLTGGTSRAPSVGLESGSLFPIRGRELNGYLTMGRQTTSLLQQSGSSLSGSTWSGQLSGETGALAHRQQGATALGVVLHDIGSGATKEYGFDAFGVAPADVPTELVFGKTGGVRGALVEGGRYITTDLYLAGQLRFTSGIPGIRMAKNFGTSYLLDVGLEPRLLFDGVQELGITHPTRRSGAFGVLLTRMWGF